MRNLWPFGDSPTLRTDRARWLADRAHLSRGTRWSTRLQITSPRASAVPAFCPTPPILVSISVLYIYVQFPFISFCHLKPSGSLNERWFYFLQALSKSECKGKGPWCKWLLQAHRIYIQRLQLHHKCRLPALPWQIMTRMTVWMEAVPGHHPTDSTGRRKRNFLWVYRYSTS